MSVATATPPLTPEQSMDVVSINTIWTPKFSAMETELPGGLVGMYRERVKRLACDFPIADNYFGWQAFGRSYDRAARCAMPEYLKEENFQTLRDNLDRVSVTNTTLIEHMRSQPDKSLDRFVFLDSAGLDAPGPDRRDVDRDRPRRQARFAHRLPHCRHHVAGRNRAASRHSRPSSTTSRLSRRRSCAKTAPPSMAVSIST